MLLNIRCLKTSELYEYARISILTWLTIEATLLDFATDTGSNHTGVPCSAATKDGSKRKQKIEFNIQAEKDIIQVHDKNIYMPRAC